MICLKHNMSASEIGGYLLAWESGKLDEDDLLVVLQEILDQRRIHFLISDYGWTLFYLTKKYIQEGKLEAP